MSTATQNLQFPITLRPSRKQAAAMIGVCLAFVAGGVLMVLDGKSMGYFCAGFFALGLPVFALQFHPKAAYLRLANEGFTFCSLFRAQTVRWSQVRAFGVIEVESLRMVAWNFTQEGSARGRARALSKALCGFEAALPDTYGMKAEDLADLMNVLLRRDAEARAA